MRRFLRFILKLAVLLAVLSAVVLAAVHTGVAARGLLYVAGGRLGVELEAERVRIGWDGQWRFDRFAATIPGEVEPFFTARRIELSLNSLPAIARTFDPNLTRMSLTSPSVTIARDEEGRFNVERLLDREPGRTGARRRKALPEVTIVNGSASYLRAGERPVLYSGIGFEGRQEGEVFSMRLTAPQGNSLRGTVNVETLEHELRLQIRHGGSLFSPVTERTIPDVSAEADWVGRVETVEAVRISGELTAARAQIGDVTMSARALAEGDSAGVAVDIRELQLDPWPLLQEFPFETAPLSVKGLARYSASERAITLEGLETPLLGGTVSLDARILPRRITESSMAAEFSDIRADPFAPAYLTEPTTLEGRLELGPAAGPRPLEPMAAELRLRLNSELMEAAALGEITARAYMGRGRFIVSEAEVPIFGGSIAPWLSVTRREGELFFHGISELRDIDIDHVAGALRGERKRVPGRLNGTVKARMARGAGALSGSGDLRISNSDLMHTQIIGAVYQAMNMAFVGVEPAGEGRIRLSASGPAVEVTSFEYFNRGVEVRGGGTIRDVSLGAASPVEGVVTGSLRPLRDVGLPGSRSLDRLLAGLQTGFVSVRVEGTAGNVSTRVVPLPEVQDALRRLLGQQHRRDY